MPFSAARPYLSSWFAVISPELADYPLRSATAAWQTGSLWVHRRLCPATAGGRTHPVAPPAPKWYGSPGAQQRGVGLRREERTSGLWGNRARGGGVNAHLYCWTEGELTAKGKSNPEPAILCCLMPCGDTTEPRAAPGDVFYISRRNTWHEDKPHKRRAKQNTGWGKESARRRVRAHSAPHASCRRCRHVVCVRCRSPGKMGCCRAIPTCVRASTALVLPHLPPQCLCPSSCDASQYEDTQARWKAVPGEAVLQQPVTAGEMLEYIKAVQSARGPWEPSGNRCWQKPNGESIETVWKHLQKWGNLRIWKRGLLLSKGYHDSSQTITVGKTGQETVVRKYTWQKICGIFTGALQFIVVILSSLPSPWGGEGTITHPPAAAPPASATSAVLRRGSSVIHCQGLVLLLEAPWEEGLWVPQAPTKWADFCVNKKSQIYP